MADAIFSPGTRAALMGCLDDIDTLLAENAELFEDLRAVLAGACTSATRAGARDATLRRLEAENAWLDRARKARRVLAAAGPDPMPVVRAAMRYLDHGDDGRLGSAWVKFREAVDAYRKAGGK